MYEIWHENFLKSGLPHKMTLEQIYEILETKYKAHEVELRSLVTIPRDKGIRFNRIAKCYIIDDPAILDNIQSENEKKKFQEKYDQYVEEHDDEPYPAEVGKQIDVVIESFDDKHCNAMTFNGDCRVILDEMIVFFGVRQEEVDLESERYRIYLRTLQKLNYI
jgi:hypothetical protein